MIQNKPSLIQFQMLVIVLSMTAISTGQPVYGQRAQSIASPRPASWIVDQTDTLSVFQEDLIDDLCNDVHRRFNRELAIAVIPSTGGQPARKFATDLFNHWGVGGARTNNGILIFAAIDDRNAELILGRGIDTPANRAVAQRIMDKVITPKFKQGDAGSAIYEGAHACAKQILGVGKLQVKEKLPVITAEQPIPGGGTTDASAAAVANGASDDSPEITAEAPAAEQESVGAMSQSVQAASIAASQATNEIDGNPANPDAASKLTTDATSVRDQATPRVANNNRAVPAKRNRQARKKNVNWTPWLFGFGGLGVVGAFFGGRHYLRYRTRLCDKCLLDRVLLTEVQDDEFLNTPQRTEEKIGSVDYDVWACLECEDVVKIRHGRWFTRYSRCPTCSYVTRFKIKKTVMMATQISGGLIHVTENCKNCSYHHSYTYATPRLPKPSSSSGGSGWRSSRGGSSSGGFGGGRSSGGGASGKW